MNSGDRLPVLLQRVSRAALEAHEMVGTCSREQFRSNLILQRAVGMTLIMALDAAILVMQKAPDFVDDHPEIPWAMMRGMRNRMAHGYIDIDLDRVYEAARVDALELSRTIDAILDNHIQGE